MSCITLLSDFGLQDATVAVAKGIIMQHCPHLPIIDISHDVEPFYLQQASYLLKATTNNFSEGSYHLVLFDLFYDKQPKLLLVRHQNKYFLAPNNGILPLTFESEMDKVWLCYEQDSSHQLSDWITNACRVIQQLQKNTPEELNLPLHEVKNAPKSTLPNVFENTIECHVIHIDRFENVVLNITEDQFKSIGKGREFSIEFMRDESINTISNQYNSVKNGNKLCRFNNAGYLELAINRGKAASLFGLKMRKEQQLFYNTIKIKFNDN